MAPIANLAAIAASLSHHVSVAAIASSALILLFTTTYIFYNLFLHPLRSYPGPRLWAATRLPWMYHKVRGSLHARLPELHAQYGSPLRIGPNEVSYTTDTAWKTIYGHRTGSMEMAKDMTFSFPPLNGVHGIITSDRAGHARQRRMLAHAFSEQALREQESIFQEYVDKLIALLRAKSAEEPVNMVRAYNFTTFDVIGDLSFGESFGCLDKDKYHPIVEILFEGIKGMVWKSCLDVYGLSGLQKLLMPERARIGRMRNYEQSSRKVDSRVARNTDRKDFISYILAAPPDVTMTRPELHTNAVTLIAAGSETTATLLSGATYNILKHPRIYARLVAEIRAAFASDADITLTSVAALPYMLAVLDESLRLYPPVADTLPRIVPPGGAVVDNLPVPAGASVGVHPASASRLPDNFHRPEDFLPERWLPGSRRSSRSGSDSGYDGDDSQDDNKDAVAFDETAPFRDDNRAASQPFSYGPRACLGRNLAYAEMRLILAKVLFNFDMELEQESWGWQERQRVFLIWEKSPLMCRLTPVVGT